MIKILMPMKKIIEKMLGKLDLGVFPNVLLYLAFPEDPGCHWEDAIFEAKIPIENL